MYTCYFAKYRYNQLSNGVSIALSAPFEIETYPDLFPTWDMLDEYYKTSDKDKYIKIYHEEILSLLDPQKVYDDLKDKILLCWEPKGKFCHRHLVTDWLNKNLNTDIKEL